MITLHRSLDDSSSDEVRIMGYSMGPRELHGVVSMIDEGDKQAKSNFTQSGFHS